MIRRAFTALLAVSAAASSSASDDEPHASLRNAPLDDFDRPASVLKARGLEGLPLATEAHIHSSKRADHWRRRLQQGANVFVFTDILETPVNDQAKLQVKGTCRRWVQKPNVFKAILPPGVEDNTPKRMVNDKMKEMRNFDFKSMEKLCEEDHNGDAADHKKCHTNFEALRALGPAAVSQARACGGRPSFPCRKPNMDDIIVTVTTPPQPFADSNADYKVKSIEWIDRSCTLQLDFTSDSGAPSVWSEIRIAAMFDGDTSGNDNSGGNKNGPHQTAAREHKV